MVPGPGSSASLGQVEMGQVELARVERDRAGLSGPDLGGPDLGRFNSAGFGADGHAAHPPAQGASALDALERDALRSGEQAPHRVGPVSGQGSQGAGDPFAVLAPYPGGPSPRGAGAAPDPAEALIGIDEVQKALNRSRASVYRYSNTDPRTLNPPFNPRRLNPEYRTDQKDPLLFHPNEVARFARDVLRIKEVTVEVLNAPSTATQELLTSILDELRGIRQRLDRLDPQPGLRGEPSSRFDQHSRPAA
jgi:hypothetical protein